MTDEKMARLEELAKSVLDGTENLGELYDRLGARDVLALIERARRAETPPVVPAGAEPVRLTMADGPVSYAAANRPDGRAQGVAFTPPVPSEEAEKVLRVFNPDLTPRDGGAPED